MVLTLFFFFIALSAQYEHRCQVVEVVLRQEMEEAVLLLSIAYDSSLQQMRSNGGQFQPPQASWVRSATFFFSF